MEGFKVLWTGEALQYTDSKDPKNSVAGIEICTGRKWSATQELWMAEAKLRHKAVVGAVVKGRAGIGRPPSLQYNKAQGKEMSQLVEEEVRATVDEKRTSTMAGMRQQRAGIGC